MTIEKLHKRSPTTVSAAKILCSQMFLDIWKEKCVARNLEAEKSGCRVNQKKLNSLFSTQETCTEENFDTLEN